MMKPGLVTLIGSGETSRTGGQAFERLVKAHPPGSRIAVLETPAGFELNSPAVAGRVAEYLRKRLVNYCPQVEVIPARHRNTLFTPDDAEVVKPLASADLIFLGPGSPTYAVRQLHESLAWELVQARFWQGASLALASAAAISTGRYTLPVYEIYKVGEELHWIEGLDLFGSLGLRLAIVTHWNNREGGAELDTSHCFMGVERFEWLKRLLPGDITILGVDEQTALEIDLQAGWCEVLGIGQVHILNGDGAQGIGPKEGFPLSRLGVVNLPVELPRWSAETETLLLQSKPGPVDQIIPEDVMRLAEERQIARKSQDWQRADELRAKLESLGWTIMDTGEGFQLARKPIKD